MEEQREDIAILLVEHGADLYFENKVYFKLFKFFFNISNIFKLTAVRVELQIV